MGEKEEIILEEQKENREEMQLVEIKKETVTEKLLNEVISDKLNELIEIRLSKDEESKNPTVGLILSLLKNSDNLDSLIRKFKIDIEKDKLKSILNILNFLDNQETKIEKIVVEIEKVLSDGKVEIQEIPRLVTVINDNLEIITHEQIKESDVSVLIKLLILVMIEVGVIKLSNEDFIITCKLIDNSIGLLLSKIEIKKVPGCVIFGIKFC